MTIRETSIGWLMSRSNRDQRKSGKAKPASAAARVFVPALADVCASPDKLLGRLDIAAVNLMCASSLPGAERLQYGKMFDWLDEAARRVDLEIRRHWYQYLRSPGTFQNSPGFFCCHMLLQVLQEDCGVRYNPARAVDQTWQDHDQEPNFRDSRDLFLHGIIAGPGGTCGSMPVVYVAVGRRLGYPLKLVEARGHLFFRWDDPLGVKRGVPERFNVEGAGHGISSFPDEYYRTWPEPWTEAERKANYYLRSLTPKEELASFLCTRAACLEDNGRNDEAVQAYRWACGLVPHDVRPRNNLHRLIGRLQKNVFEMNAVVAWGQSSRSLAQPLPGMLQLPGMMPPGAPPHGDSCRCWHCEQARQAAAPSGMMGHHRQCGCRQCQELRQPLRQARGHVSGCGCSHCMHAQVDAGQRLPGHPLGCGCGVCEKVTRMQSSRSLKLR